LTVACAEVKKQTDQRIRNNCKIIIEETALVLIIYHLKVTAKGITFGSTGIIYSD
jgi:hypothetical protein